MTMELEQRQLLAIACRTPEEVRPVVIDDAIRVGGQDTFLFSVNADKRL
jgi:hypothetical protein